MTRKVSEILGINITVSFKGNWDASTGQYPSTPKTGDMYLVSVGGNIGSPAVTYNVDETILYTGTEWIKVGSGGTASDVVIKLREVSDVDNKIFNNFTGAFNAAKAEYAANGVPVFIEIDYAVDQNYTIDPGVYNLTGIRFKKRDTNIITSELKYLELPNVGAAAAIFEPAQEHDVSPTLFMYPFGGLRLTTNSRDLVFDLPAGTINIIGDDDTLIDHSESLGPVFYPTDTNSPQVNLFMRNGRYVRNGGPPMFHTQTIPSGTLTVYFDGEPLTISDLYTGTVPFNSISINDTTGRTSNLRTANTDVTYELRSDSISYYDGASMPSSNTPTITDKIEEVEGNLSAHESASDPHPQYALQVNNIAGTTYTVTQTDYNKLLLFDTDQLVTITLPEAATEQLSPYFVFYIRNKQGGMIAVATEGTDILINGDMTVDSTVVTSIYLEDTTATVNTYVCVGDFQQAV